MSRRQQTRMRAAGTGTVALFALSSIWFAVGTRASADGGGSAPSSLTTRRVEATERIAYRTHRIPSTDLRSGCSKTVRPGADGLRKVVYEVVLDGDREVTRTAVSSIVTKEPSPEVIYVGTSASATGRGRYGARGYFAGRRVVTMVATGYDPSPASNGGTTRTSTGIKVGHGLVAVDPRFIPMGTKLFIEGYGHAVAADVGGAIKGNRIDLGHDTARGARNVGRRTVRVHILN